MTTYTRYILNKIQGHLFSEVAEVPQAAATQTHRAWGRLKSTTKLQNPQDTCSKNPGLVFSEVAEAPQAAGTQTHRSGGP